MSIQPYVANEYIEDYAALTRWCESAAEAHPEWVRLTQIGRSHHGKPIWMLTLGARALDVSTTPALWIDGGTHASEWTGVCAAIYTASRWITALAGGEDEATRAWFERRVAMIVPCISPDGYDAMRSGAPYLRSSLRPPRHAGPRHGLEPRDVDGDGAVRSMRWRHPSGPMVPDEQVPIMMRPRTISDDPDNAYFVASEGEFINWDGHSWVGAPREFGVDLNRNFPAYWSPFSMFGMDAGAYAISEPESRAVIDAFASNPLIGGALTFHTYTGCILTEPARRDSPLSKTDVTLMYDLARDLADGTDYKVYKVCPDFMYDPDKPIVGAWSDTITSVFGVAGYTIEFWDPYGWADQEVSAPAAFFADPDIDIIRAMLRAFSELPGAVEPWRPFDHPQLGAVEIGGIDYLHTIRNPPTDLLAAECDKGYLMADRMRRALPDVALSVSTEALGDGVYLIELSMENTGYFGTSGLGRGEQIGAAPSCWAEISGAEILAGSAHVEIDHLAGWGDLRSGASKHPVYGGLGDRSHRSVARWTVRAGSEAPTVRWSAGRGGRGTLRVSLP